MPDEKKEVLREVFDREVEWPSPRDEPDRERTHPDTIPDTPEGPFKDWIKDRLDGEDEIDYEDEVDDDDEEIGYEGER